MITTLVRRAASAADKPSAHGPTATRIANAAIQQYRVSRETCIVNIMASPSGDAQRRAEIRNGDMGARSSDGKPPVAEIATLALLLGGAASSGCRREPPSASLGPGISQGAIIMSHYLDVF